MRLSHAETQALISARLDGPLDPVAERELTAHLATCESCRAFNSSATSLARGLQSLPYLPASPTVTRAVLDHVSTPRSPWSWIPGALPANALPAAAAIATAVIVVFVGSFAAFRFLGTDEEPSTLPASTLTVTDLAQRAAETAGATEPGDAVEGQAAVTEEPTVPTERNPATDPTETAENSTLEDGSTEPSETGPVTDPTPTEIGPPSSSGASDAAQSQPATEEPATEPAPAPTEVPAPTEEPAPEPPATLSASVRQALGLETPVPTEEPAPEPSSTPEPTLEPVPTEQPVPTAAPTLEPTETLTEAPTATAEPTEEPTEESSDLGSDLRIVGPQDEPTEEPAQEPTSEPTPLPTEEPTAEPTEEPTAVPAEPPTATPTDVPTATPAEPATELPIVEPPIDSAAEPTEEPEATDEPAPTEEQEATVVPIEQRGETPVDPDDDENPDDGPAPEDQATAESDDPAGIEQTIIDADGPDTGDASPEDDGIIQDTGDDGPDQVIEPTGDDDPEDAPDDTEDGPSGDEGQGGPVDDPEGDAGSSSLADADVFAGLGEVPGDPGARLGISADGTLVFSSQPGRVSLERDGISLETAVVETGQVVQACANGECVNISADSATSPGHIDNPIGWLDGEIIYERLNGDQYAVEFRAIDLDTGSDRLIDGGDADLERFIRPFALDGALLVPAPAGWLRITPSSVEIVDGNPYGGDLNLIRIDQSAGRIAYVSGGSLVLASLASPGSPIVQLPFAGSDYDFSPDGSRIAVVTGAGIEIWDTSGNVLMTYPSDGIQVGGLTWLDQGLVVVDLSNGSLRIVMP